MDFLHTVLVYHVSVLLLLFLMFGWEEGLGVLETLQMVWLMSTFSFFNTQSTLATTPKTDLKCKLLSIQEKLHIMTRHIPLQTFQKKIQVFWVTVSHLYCSLGKTTDDTSAFISEELGISVSTFNVVVSDWHAFEPERKRSKQ